MTTKCLHSPQMFFKKTTDEEKRDLMATRCLHSSQRGEKNTWWPLGCLLVHKERKRHMVRNMCNSNPQREKKGDSWPPSAIPINNKGKRDLVMATWSWPLSHLLVHRKPKKGTWWPLGGHLIHDSKKWYLVATMCQL